MDEVEISVGPNGPYLVKGRVSIVDGEGKPNDVGGKEVGAPCRGGRSTTKPFGDGTHTRIPFAAAERAVADFG